MRIMLVDDHPVLLIGLQSVIDRVQDFRVVASCKTRDEAIQYARNHTVNVIIFDLILDGIREWRTVEQLSSIRPDAKIIVLSSLSEEDAGVDALERNCAGFLNKELAPELLESYIREALEGKIVGSAKLHQLFRKVLTGETDITRVLTPRQQEIFRLLGQGMNVKAIADKLSLSPNTIYNQTEDMCRRLQLSTLQELTYFAVRHSINNP
ncbi:response regulator transcription factor [bacterium]|nr:response regulator transcription factor [bacterium]